MNPTCSGFAMSDQNDRYDPAVWVHVKSKKEKCESESKHKALWSGTNISKHKIKIASPFPDLVVVKVYCSWHLTPQKKVINDSLLS